MVELNYWCTWLIWCNYPLHRLATVDKLKFKVIMENNVSGTEWDLIFPYMIHILSSICLWCVFSQGFKGFRVKFKVSDLSVSSSTWSSSSQQQFFGRGLFKQIFFHAPFKWNRHVFWNSVISVYNLLIRKLKSILIHHIHLYLFQWLHLYFFFFLISHNLATDKLIFNVSDCPFCFCLLKVISLNYTFLDII